MKAVIFLYFQSSDDNFIESIQSQLNHDVKQFLVTDIPNLHKGVYNKLESIFHYKDQTECLINVKNIINYLKLFNYTQLLIVNVNKEYDSELEFKDISTIEKEFTVVNSIL
jgi:hypothetical protein